MIGYKTFEKIPLSENKVADSKLLTDLLTQNADKFGSVVNNKDSFRLQIIFTQIDRDEKNRPHFTSHFFHVTDQYFYPASTVKLPTAVLALEKLNNLKLKGVDARTTMLTDSAWSGQSTVYNDPTSATGKPSVEQYIKKILLVSDNDAFNRLYEFIGQAPLNDRLHQLGFKDAQILHRLSIPLTQEQNRHTNPVRFIDANGNLIFTQPMKYSDMVYQPRYDVAGRGYMEAGKDYYKGDVLVEKPMDFSKKNRVRLPYLHQMLQWVMFPESQSGKGKLNLSAKDYSFLHKYMSMLPTESKYPNYPGPDYWPAYCKFMMMGSQKGDWPNNNIRIFNKVGDAYGFLIDVAYIVDFESKTEFMVSCSMLCNSDGIFNDDKYDYETIGFPFMKNLGEVLYQYEKTRPRKYAPDLSKLVFDYSK
ncbi:MAG: serine hydrolase [Chitinophagaceae bacterium]